MGDVQRSFFADNDLPPEKGKRRRMPERLSPPMRKWLTRLARIGARITWTIELLYDPRKGGQGELCQRAMSGDHTLVLDTVRDGEYQMSLLAGDIEAFMTPPEACRHPPGSPAKVQILAARQAARAQLWHDADAR